MFRLWFMTFAGTPRDHHVAEHAHESPQVMVMPLLVLAVLAVVAGWTLPGGFGIANLLEQSRPAGTARTATGGFAFGQTLTVSRRAPQPRRALPFHGDVDRLRHRLGGVLLAAAMYVWRIISPAVVATMFRPVYTFLANRWYFDELYHAIFVVPAHGLAAVASGIDQGLIDPLINFLAWTTRQVANLDAWIDRTFIDGLVDSPRPGHVDAGSRAQEAPDRQLRQYVTFIVAGTWPCS
jgi:NADH:ubiquinone oxidoreductase subunit 5 (subunit L)/multisubunit Na+/H+ antiporter MnhA subunit